MPPEDPGLTEAPAGGATPADNGDERPSWLPDNFKTPEDMAKSYTEAQRKISEQGNALRERDTRLDELQEQMESLAEQQNRPVDNQQHPLMALYERAVEEQDAQAMFAVQAELARLQTEQMFAAQQKQAPEEDYGMLTTLAENQIRAKYPETYDGLREQTIAKLQENPNLLGQATNLESVQHGIETAFALAQRDQLLSQQSSLAEQQAEQEAARQRKLAAQTGSGSGPRAVAPDEQAATWERIKGADVGGFSTSRAAS